MKKRTIAALCALVTFVVGVAVARMKLAEWRAHPTPAFHETGGYRFSGPYVHGNLTMFLIHAPDEANAKVYLSLAEALERKLVTVHETGEVNELTIENVSATEEVLVHAGDIVKGGRQDRVLAVDLILPAKSEKISIASFCVEQQRWQQRGAESADHFSMTDSMVATKDLKVATRQASQGRVWEKVSEAQEKLSAGVASDVRSDLSTSSLQLTLEDGELQKSAAEYTSQLAPVIENAGDAVGVVFVINNVVSGGDSYATNAMFRRFSGRLLKSAAIEAVGERLGTKGAVEVSAVAISSFLKDVASGSDSIDDVTVRTRMIKREGKSGLFFETRDMAHGAAWVHRSFLGR
jgi:hypothetical protein